MPRLPSEQDLGPAPSLESRRSIATYDASPLARGVAALSAGATRLGDAAVGIGLQMKRKEDAENAIFDQAKAESAFIPAHSKLLTAQKNDPDPEAYARESQAALQAAAANIRDDRARQLWLMGKAGALASGTAAVAGYAHSAAADSALAGIRQSEDDGLNTIVHGSAEDADTMTRAIGTRYDEAAAKGYITEVQAQAYKKAFAKRGIYARIGTLDPEDQISIYRGAPGTRDQLIDRITGVESGGDASARNPNSTATGLGQFTEGTWLATVQKHRPDLLGGKSRAEVLALRNDPTLSREMTGHLLDDNGKALAGAGLPVNPTTSYLAHFLGSCGATALKAAPETPVSDVLGGDQIAANRSVLAGKTVGDVYRWAERKMGGGTEARLASLLPEDQREVGLRHAEALYDKQQRDLQRAMQEDAQTVKARIADDLASIETTGQANPNLRAEDVGRLFGPQAAQDFLADRARSSNIHSALDGIRALPEAEALERLQRLQPRPGAEGFRADAEAYGRAAKQVDKMLSLRRTDPAKAVDSLPAVVSARAAAQYDTAPDGRQSIKPESTQSIIRARLATQAQLGIPDGAQLPMTRAEAQEAARPVELAVKIGDPRKMRDALTETVTRLQTNFGEHADRAFEQVLREAHVGRQTEEMAAVVLRKLAARQMPTHADARALDEAAKTSAAEQAVRSVVQTAPTAPAVSPPAPLNFDSTPGATGTDYLNPQPAAPPRPRFPTPDPRAIDMLREKPGTARQFDAVYGSGSSERVLAITGTRK